MSERETSIRPRDRSHMIVGHAAWGRKSRAEMLKLWRERYSDQLQEAQHALALSDDELIVETYLGPYARRRLEEVTK